MTPQPLLGLFLHALGGVAAASFYAPLKFIRKWPWECFYLVMGVFAWAVTPWVFAFATTPDLIGVLSGAPIAALGWSFLFGLLWGIGAVTFGLSMRYLGMALGMSVALGFCAVFGTLVPPIYHGELGAIAATRGGQTVLFGVALCVVGILVAGYAGVRKENEVPQATGGSGESGQSEFAPGLGLLVAFICGLMSACFAFGIQSGQPIAELAVEAGANPLFKNNPTLCVILLGGFLTNTLWCLFQCRRNRSFPAFVSTSVGQSASITGLCLLAGVIWYFQFFFYGMGSTKMGAYDFSSWSLHMAAIIIFGNLWGIFFKEWKGVSGKTLATVWTGIIILILSTAVIGWGNSLSSSAVSHEPKTASTMKFSCADFTFPVPSHSTTLKLIRTLGFEAVDLGIFEERSHHYPSQIALDPKASAEKMKAALDANGLTASDVFVQFGPDPHLAAVNDPDEALRAQMRGRFEAMVEFTVRLGASHMTGLPGVWQSEEQAFAEWELAVEETRWRQETAEARGITYAFEPHVGSICSDPQSAAKFAEESGTSITLDFGHFIYQGMTTEEALPLCKYASHFHARGGAPGKLQSTVAENTIDFNAVLAALKQHDYSGYHCLEYVYVDWEGCNRTDNVSETLQLLRALRAPGFFGVGSFGAR